MFLLLPESRQPLDFACQTSFMQVSRKTGVIARPDGAMDVEFGKNRDLSVGL